MTEQTIEIEAETLEEARERVKSQIPEGFYLLSERIISDGKPRTIEAVASTTEEAFTEAQRRLPADVTVLESERRILSTPDRTVIAVEAFDENSAKREAGLQANVGAWWSTTKLIKNVKMTAVGKKRIPWCAGRHGHHVYRLERCAKADHRKEGCELL
jgi:hypothetical protein